MSSCAQERLGTEVQSDERRAKDKEIFTEEGGALTPD
jgi:hypothetical protein